MLKHLLRNRMKRLLTSLALLALVGAGCTSATPSEPSFQVANTYTNTEFHFAFDYPKEMDVHVRPDETRSDSYAGLELDFFASLRDLVRDKNPTNIFWMYAAPGLSEDEFVAGLESTSENVRVTSREDVTFGEVVMRKLTNTTDLGADKIHYLFDQDGTLIIFSVFIAETTAAEPILETIRVIE